MVAKVTQAEMENQNNDNDNELLAMVGNIDKEFQTPPSNRDTNNRADTGGDEGIHLNMDLLVNTQMRQLVKEALTNPHDFKEDKMNGFSAREKESLLITLMSAMIGLYMSSDERKLRICNDTLYLLLQTKNRERWKLLPRSMKPDDFLSNMNSSEFKR